MKCSSCGANIESKKFIHGNGHCEGYLKAKISELREALEEIFNKSEDNWAAARAERALGRGWIVVPSRNEGK